jgi:hypothetical protein
LATRAARGGERVACDNTTQRGFVRRRPAGRRGRAGDFRQDAARAEGAPQNLRACARALRATSSLVEKEVARNARAGAQGKLEIASAPAGALLSLTEERLEQVV